ncbi:hypothetical protein LOK49_LG03G01610 [Camellia lanceoleosa]|uniref:Uncharacterized protein n=1 Tax=Camellia lanceoleosa TaxID=1840588 RepID=A0ACC0I766_9ERIC|nr:hypothetical protein LOK49_LG03G01610 [Camellia lanceoleosa]
MAKPQEKKAFMNSPSSPINEHEQEGNDDYEETFSARGCSCFRLFCFERRQSNGWESNRLLQQHNGEHKETWLANMLRPVKESSEMLAGPKWKNFIRRVGKYFGKRKTQFRYDSHSYALNFDDGTVEDETVFLGEEQRTGL